MKIDIKTSPNSMSRNGWIPDIIVAHISEGFYDSGIDWLCKPSTQASAHFFVSKLGNITQLVDIRLAAWVNGTTSSKTDKRFYGNSTSDIVRDRQTNANYYCIGIEHEGFYTDGHGRLTTEQETATVWLLQYIKQQVMEIYGTDIKIDREHFLGHYEITPITKPHCPGEEYQFDSIIARANEVTTMDEIRMKNMDNDYEFFIRGLVIDDSNLVSARDLLNALGYTVTWENDTICFRRE